MVLNDLAFQFCNFTYALDNEVFDRNIEPVWHVDILTIAKTYVGQIN